MRLVLVHGISNDRPKYWAWDWSRSLRGLLTEQPSEVVCISWESVHEADYAPARSARQNLLQDLGVTTNTRVLSYFEDKLRPLADSDEPVWIIAHSLGCALTYQALNYLQYARCPDLWISRLITIGSPLWLPYSRIVRRVVSLNAAMPRASKLVNVGQWIDIQGQLDAVAGFGLVKMPAATRRLHCWSHHSFGSYARSGAFRASLA